MLKRVTIDNLKCFEHLEIELSNLNVFAGINSMGKSTIIQTLLLLRQSFDMQAISKGVYLNGSLVNIGTGYDLLYRSSDKDVISICLDVDDINYKWDYKYEKDADYLENTSEQFPAEACLNVNLFGDNFAYVSADRIGPQRYYGSSHFDIYDGNKVGNKGELYAGYLAERGESEKVSNAEILHEAEKSKSLINQTAAWLSEISPGIRLSPKKYAEAGLVSMEYNVDSEGFSPMNIGFGISYVAPIVVALLKAKPGDLVILENPEAHLHPRGQRKMGELIAHASAGGVQVIVETHSDHLLNGIRLCVKNKKIDRKLITLNYFYMDVYVDSQSITHYVHTKCNPCIQDDGSLSSWPDGFFDEWDKALEELI